jgi:hypothetical protein
MDGGAPDPFLPGHLENVLPVLENKLVRDSADSQGCHGTRELAR